MDRTMSGMNVSPRQSLESLVLSAQRGDPLAFEDLVKSTHLLLRKVALPLVPASAVEDVIQETYATAYQKLACLKSPPAFLTWLTRIALHICYDWRRRAENQRVDVGRKVSEGIAPEPLDVVSLRQALDTLNPADRNILILREYLELSYEEIGQILDLPSGSVKSRLFYARKRLKEVLV